MAIKFKIFRHWESGKKRRWRACGQWRSSRGCHRSMRTDGQAAPSDRDVHRPPQTERITIHFGAQKFSVVPCFALQPKHFPKQRTPIFFFLLYHFRTFYDLELFGPSVLWSSNLSSVSRPINKTPSWQLVYPPSPACNSSTASCTSQYPSHYRFLPAAPQLFLRCPQPP